MLAIVYAFDKFRSYLVGQKVIVYSNHATLKYLLSKSDDGVPINESFHGEHLLTLAFKELPRFADFANYLVSRALPYGLDFSQKKKFLH